MEGDGLPVIHVVDAVGAVLRVLSRYASRIARHANAARPRLLDRRLTSHPVGAVEQIDAGASGRSPDKRTKAPCARLSIPCQTLHSYHRLIISCHRR